MINNKKQQKLFNANANAFKKRYPEYYNIVMNSKKDKKFKLKKTKEKFNTLFIENIDIYNEYPVKTCANNILVHQLTYCKLAVFFGFGLGYDLLFYSEQCSQKYQTDKIIIFEHNPYMIKLAMQNINLVQIFELTGIELILYDGNEYKLFNKIKDELMKNSNFYLLRAMNFFYNNEYFNLYKSNYILMLNIFRTAASHTLMYFGNDVKDSLIGVWNMMNNIDVIIENPGINMLKDKFKNIPAVCIAAGPSLDKNINELKELDKEALLIACDACLQPLLKKGIKPHLITSLEREIKIVDLFKNIKEDYSDVYLAACPVVYNEVYKTYKGPKLIVYRNFDHFKWLGIERGMLEIKVSPGNMNFKIAEYLGCNPIILVGQDLALDSGQTNVKGTPLGHKQKSYLNEPRLKVKGNFVEYLETTRSLNMMLESFIVDVYNFKGKTINATEGGAFINGTEIMDLKETKEKYIKGKYNFDRNIISGYLKEFEINLNLYKAIKQKIKDTIKSFENMFKILDEVINYGENISIEKINETKQKISEDYCTWQLYFAHIAQSIFINHEMNLSSIKMDNNYIKIFIEENIKYFIIIKRLIETCIIDLHNIENKFN